MRSFSLRPKHPLRQRLTPWAPFALACLALVGLVALTDSPRVRYADMPCGRSVLGDPAPLALLILGSSRINHALDPQALAQARPDLSPIALMGREFGGLAAAATILADVTAMRPVGTVLLEVDPGLDLSASPTLARFSRLTDLPAAQLPAAIGQRLAGLLTQPAWIAASPAPRAVADCVPHRDRTDPAAVALAALTQTIPALPRTDRFPAEAEASAWRRLMQLVTTQGIRLILVTVPQADQSSPPLPATAGPWLVPPPALMAWLRTQGYANARHLSAAGRARFTAWLADAL